MDDESIHNFIRLILNNVGWWILWAYVIGSRMIGSRMHSRILLSAHSAWFYVLFVFVDNTRHEIQDDESDEQNSISAKVFFESYTDSESEEEVEA